MAIKINDPDHIEVIEVRLLERRHLWAFKNKLEELMEEKAFDNEKEG